MIHIRNNGKFFTDPITGNNQMNAFLKCVRELVNSNALQAQHENKIIDRGFRRTLMPADDAVTSFMWDRAVAAEENDVHVIFSLFDIGGWRFFGRI
jgi:hypothetical protein